MEREKLATSTFEKYLFYYFFLKDESHKLDLQEEQQRYFSLKQQFEKLQVESNAIKQELETQLENERRDRKAADAQQHNYVDQLK